MSWHDRDYHREGPNGGDLGASMSRFFHWSFSVGTYLGVTVRVHWSFVFVAISYLLLDPVGRQYPWWMLRSMAVLFLSVLLHEFGHALACRSVGGRADQILMWPLGGLAFCAPPRRPWPEFVTVACGPLVNVVLALAAYLALLIGSGDAGIISLNPFRPWSKVNPFGFWGVVADIYAVNYLLLCFNLLLVFYPFDGGRLVQIGLWKRLGYFRSMVIATRVGMVGAIIVSLVGLVQQNLLLVFIALFGFWTCYQQAAALPLEREMEGFGGIGGEYEIGDSADPREPRIGWYRRWRARRVSRRRTAEKQAAIDLEMEVDRILVKVKEHGLHSLTEREKKTLQRATTEKQKRV